MHLPMQQLCVYDEAHQKSTGACEAFVHWSTLLEWLLSSTRSCGEALSTKMAQFRYS